MERFLPKANDVWRHADGTNWIVIKAEINDDRQIEVKIAALDYSFRIESWLIDDFLDEVDHDNHPECDQKYVFEYVGHDEK